MTFLTHMYTWISTKSSELCKHTIRPYVVCWLVHKSAELELKCLEEWSWGHITLSCVCWSKRRVSLTAFAMSRLPWVSLECEHTSFVLYRWDEEHSSKHFDVEKTFQIQSEDCCIDFAWLPRDCVTKWDSWKVAQSTYFFIVGVLLRLTG